MGAGAGVGVIIPNVTTIVTSCIPIIIVIPLLLVPFVCRFIMRSSVVHTIVVPGLCPPWIVAPAAIVVGRFGI